MLIKVILRFTCLDFVFMMVYCFGNLATNFIDFSLSQGKLHGFIESEFQLFLWKFQFFLVVHCLPVYAIVVTYSMARVIKHVSLLYFLIIFEQFFMATSLPDFGMSLFLFFVYFLRFIFSLSAQFFKKYFFWFFGIVPFLSFFLELWFF